MTFSILARDETGVGMAMTSSSPCVAARCLHLRSRVGGVASQNITDPRFGPALLDRLENGHTAEDALTWLGSVDDTMVYRQVALLGTTGPPAVHSGEQTLGVHRARTGPDAVAAGNLLQEPGVIDAVIEAFETAAGQLEQRLLTALLAGGDAGGEAGPVHSAGLGVVRDAGWPETDLRVDWSDRPLEEMEELLDLWLPRRDDYVTRGKAPHTAPSYGVPGDE